MTTIKKTIDEDNDPLEGLGFGFGLGSRVHMSDRNMKILHNTCIGRSPEANIKKNMEGKIFLMHNTHSIIHTFIHTFMKQ